jgi:hypothetical protein
LFIVQIPPILRKFGNTMGIYTSIFLLSLFIAFLFKWCNNQKFTCHIIGLAVPFSTAKILRNLKARIPGQENMRRFSTCLMQTKHRRPRCLDYYQVRVHGNYKGTIKAPVDSRLHKPLHMTYTEGVAVNNRDYHDMGRHLGEEISSTSTTATRRSTTHGDLFFGT